jgi:23S rRNA (cytosine1962-C5)-methyltransferase
MPTDRVVVVSHRAEERIRAGHPWIYRSDVVDVRADAGDVVTLLGTRGRRLGQALYSDRSEIAIRALTTGPEPVTERTWRDRLEAAVEYRRRLGIDATAYRLVHGEADRLPSLIVDCYGPYLVIQTLSQATDRLQGELVRLLVELLQPAGILARNDARVRELEGLPRTVEAIYGDVPERVIVREGAVEYETSLWTGQKTGLFLDQRENREAAVRYASGRVLDCFAYHGGFALHLAPRASDVVAIDISEDAAERVAVNAIRNGLMNVQARVANVFDALRELERTGERFSTIVLDPPAFAKNRAALDRALAGYKEINLRALKLLTSGGYLITCTCSYHVDEALFVRVLHEASHDARATVVLVEKRQQSRDHPVLLGVPETSYLKCCILRRIG